MTVAAELSLEAALRAVDPSVVLLPRRTLRRVIKLDRGLHVLGLLVPHRKSYCIRATSLKQHLSADELPTLASDSELLILLPEPTSRSENKLSWPLLLRKYWRMLFHARIHRALEADKPTVHWAKIDPTVRAEIATVLKQENYLLPPVTPESLFVEFAAVFLELWAFNPELAEAYFPAIDDQDAIAELLQQDIDADQILIATRPEGAAEPVQQAEPAHHLPVPQQAHAESSRFCLEELCERLQAALALTETQKSEWQLALPALLDEAERGFWTPSARLLYDLQKVCIDHEQQVYALDLLPWLFTLGRRPLKRPLEGQREVRIAKHLRSAARRLEHIHLDAEPRHRLKELLHVALTDADHRLRDRFRPLLLDGLDKVGLQPANFPERIARTKLTEELLDRVAEEGFFNFSHLRDALSRNQLKLPDLGSSCSPLPLYSGGEGLGVRGNSQRSPLTPAPLPRSTGGEGLFVTARKTVERWGGFVGTWFGGDKLLQLNRQYRDSLAGVYRPGEVYLRVLQAVSALLFGTQVGRWLVLFLLLPFGGAYVALMGFQHLLHLFHVHLHLHLAESIVGVLVLGLLFELLLHAPALRNGLARGLKESWCLLRALVIGFPTWLIAHPVLRAFLAGGLWRYLLLPLTPAVLAGLVAWILGAELAFIGQISAALFLLTALLFNTRLGLDLIDLITDRLLLRWQWFLGNLVPGIIRAILELFRLLLDGVERLLYAVDEQLRYRGGNSRTNLVVKAVAGQLWAVVKYIARIYVNLLIEPTVNPIKHFPVVTVAHKLMLPIIPTVFWALQWVFAPFGPVLGNTFAGITLIFVPGIFGFIVWELKENWKLFKANRASTLQPVLVGSHGETVWRLLKPGFHSGTVPKQFAKLRKAVRRGDQASTHKMHHELDHVAQAVQRFIDREFLEFLRQSQALGGLPIEVERVELATNRLRVRLPCRKMDRMSIALVIDLLDGRPTAAVTDTGWLETLTARQRQTFDLGLSGLLAKAGIGEVYWSEWVKRWESLNERRGLSPPSPPG